MTSDELKHVLKLPRGARFYKCALQVNTFDYVRRHKHPTAFTEEDAYNQAIVAACLANGVEVIGLADHYRIKSAERLIAAARAEGLVVFPGFEAVSKEGVHFLCLFDPRTEITAVQARIHECGVHTETLESPLGTFDAEKLLDAAPAWPAQIVAAHIGGGGGLFRVLQAGQARKAIWLHPHLHACSIAGSIDEAPQDLRPIVSNESPDYKRANDIAVLNCQDVCCPEDLAKPSTSCYVKMTETTGEGMRQAFLDPGSRIRLASDPEPEEHIEFIAMRWESNGFLRGCALHFNENLNVLIGGRGSGKSTVVESLRYVLGIEPIGAEAQKAHREIVQDVLRSGTKVSLVVQSYRPDKKRFLIERTVPDLPRVFDGDGNVLPLRPLDVVGGVAVFGQNELAELAKRPEKVTELLTRFIPSDVAHDTKTNAIIEALKSSRKGILECEEKIARCEEELAALPNIEETLKRYKDAGVQDKLAAQASIVRAKGVVSLASGLLTPFEEAATKIESLLPVSQEFLSDDALAGLPAHEDLLGLRATLAFFAEKMEVVALTLRQHIADSSTQIKSADNAVQVAEQEAQAAYESALRELQKSRIDGAEFIKLQTDLENLAPVKLALQDAREQLEIQRQRRRNELAQWDDAKRERYQKLERAAKRVSRELPNRLRVSVGFGRNREPLENLLRAELAGRLSEAITALSSDSDLSVSALASACRAGAANLLLDHGIPSGPAERMAKAGSKLPLLIEELELPHVTQIELNVGPPKAPPDWRRLDKLSTGQKATALLYLLLLESDGPLVLDQPEDNLDNRFISEGVVPKIRAEKRRRQFIFSTHNANIPVLGDAELIVAMQAAGEPGDGYAEVPVENMGAIDKKTVSLLVEQILEGGKDAFLTRRAKYGF